MSSKLSFFKKQKNSIKQVSGDSVQRQPPGINSAFSCTAPLKETGGTVEWDNWKIVSKSGEKIIWKHQSSGQEVFWKKTDSAKQSAYAF